MKKVVETSDAGERRRWKLFTFGAFSVLALLFVLGAFLPGKKTPVAKPLDARWYTPNTARGTVLKTKTMVGNCYICHMIYVPDPAVKQPLYTHKEIELSHGPNDRCYNCHFIRNRNKFTPDFGEGIEYYAIEHLCERCHGVIYKDWQAGTHGLLQGQWRPEGRFDRSAQGCTQCHNPHKPVFEYTEIAPAPIWPERHIRKRGERLAKLPPTSKYLTEIKEIF